MFFLTNDKNENNLIYIYEKLESQGEKGFTTLEITPWLSDVLSCHRSGQDPSLIIDRREIVVCTVFHPASL